MKVLAIVQAGVAAAKVAGFAAGGFTGTGHRVAGVVYDSEWVAPKWMLQQPKYANLIGYLEAERRGYTQGGYTSAMGLPPSAASGGSQATDATAAAIMQLTQIMLAHNEHMNEWATTLGVDYHAGNAEQAMELRNKLKSFEKILASNDNARKDYHQISVVFQLVTGQYQPDVERLNKMVSYLWRHSFPWFDSEFLTIVSMRVIWAAFEAKGLLNPAQHLVGE